MTKLEVATRDAVVELIDSEIIGGGGEIYSVVAEHLGASGLTDDAVDDVDRVTRAILDSVKQWRPA